MRQEARGRMAYLLPPGTILCLPTTPFPAPKKGLPLPVLGPLRDRISCLCSHGGLTGVPQVSLPGAEVDGLPIGLSIVGGRGSDATLVARGARAGRLTLLRAEQPVAGVAEARDGCSRARPGRGRSRR